MTKLDPLLGKPCPRDLCRGTLKTVNSVPYEDRHTGKKFMQRNYACNTCGCRPEDNIRLIPIEYSSRRAC